MISVGTAIGIRVTILTVIICLFLPPLILLRANSLHSADETLRKSEREAYFKLGSNHIDNHLNFVAQQLQEIAVWLGNSNTSSTAAASPLDAINQRGEEALFQRFTAWTRFTKDVDSVSIEVFSPSASSPTQTALLEAARGSSSAVGEVPSAGIIYKVNSSSAAGTAAYSYSSVATTTDSQTGLSTVSPSAVPMAMTLTAGVDSSVGCGAVAAASSGATSTTTSAVLIAAGPSVTSMSSALRRRTLSNQDATSTFQLCVAIPSDTMGGLPTAIAVETKSQSILQSTFLQGLVLLPDHADAWFALVDLSSDEVIAFWSPTIEATVDDCISTGGTASSGGVSGEGCLPTSPSHPFLSSGFGTVYNGVKADVQNTLFSSGSSTDAIFSSTANDYQTLAKRVSASTFAGRSQLVFMMHDEEIVRVSLGQRGVTDTIGYSIGVFVLVALIGFLTKRYFLDELMSLQGAMEGVTKLEFDECEKQKQRQGLFSEINSLRAGFIRTADTIQVITRYVPREVVKDMLSAGSLNSREMISREITVIFLDITDFSKLCESLGSDDIVNLAEKYFSLATDTLTKHGCTIDKFIGDVVMGFWGAPLEHYRQGYSALSAALHLLSISKRLASEFEKYKHNLQLRIGVTRGQCAVGNIGSDERISYTALGDTVNLASRLQMLNTFYKSQLIVSQGALEDANNTFLPDGEKIINDEYPSIFAARRLGLVRVKGKAAPTAVFHVVGVNKAILPRIDSLSQQMAKLERKGTSSVSGFSNQNQNTSSNNLQAGGKKGNDNARKRSVFATKPKVAIEGASDMSSNKQHVEECGDTVYSMHSVGGGSATVKSSDHFGVGQKRSGSYLAAASTNGGNNSSMGNEGKSSRGPMSSISHTIQVEKSSLLSLAEEVNVLRGTSKLASEDQVQVLGQLTQAMELFEDMKFQEAVDSYQLLLTEKAATLAALGLNITVLTKQCDYWQLLVQHTPPREAFDPCENMTTK